MTQTPQPITIPEYLNVTDAARLLGVSPWTLRNWDNAGKLKAERHPVNGYRMYRSQDLKAILDSGELVIHRKRTFSPTIDWSDVGPSEHFVQFYDSDEYLADSVSDFLAPSLHSGEGAIMVVRSAHRAAIEKRLKSRNIDVEAAMQRGQLVVLDAAEALAQLVDGEAIHIDRFRGLVVPLVEQMSQRYPVSRIFGEMVAMLWEHNRRDAAHQVEEFWNDLGTRHRFALYCGYPMDVFGEEADGEDFAKICGHHTRVIPSESYAGLATADERMREISILQQKARALQAEVAHRRRIEEELSDFVENALEGLYKVGADGRVIWANQTALELIGCEADEFIGSPLRDFCVDPQMIDEMLARLAEGRAIYNHVAAFRCKDGGTRRVQLHANGCRENGRLVYSRWFTRDITASEQAEEDRALLAAIVESSYDAIVSKDINGVISSWNRAAEKLFGYTADEAIGRPVTMLIPEDRHDEESRILERIRRGEKVEHYETIRRRKDGQLLNLSLTISPIIDSHGRIIGASKIARDITEQRRIERELRDVEERYGRLSDLTPVGVYTCDAVTGEIAYFNRHAAKLWGREPKLGDTDERFCGSYRLWRPDGTPLAHHETPMAVTLREGRKFRNQDVILERPDGSRINVLVNIDPIRDVNGRIVGAINAFHDTTDLKRAQALVEEQRRVLEMVARGEPLPRCLDELCQSIQRVDSRIRAGIVLSDESRSRFHSIYSPNLPQVIEAMQGAVVGDGTHGTCAQAIVGGDRVTCSDVANDSRWHREWTSFCLDNGIRAVFSTPIVEGSPLPHGSVFLTFDIAKEPDEWDIRLADMAAGIAGIVLHRDRAEQALRHSEEQFRALGENVPHLAWMMHPDGWIYWYNRRWFDFTGTTLEEMEGWGWQKVHHPEHVVHVTQKFKEAVASGQPWEDTFPLRGAAGEYRWFLSRAYPIRDDAGNVKRWFGTNTDITDLLITQSALRESERRLSTLVANLPGMAYRCLNIDGRWAIEFISEGVTPILGYDAQEFRLQRKTWGEIIYTEDKDRIRRDVLGAVREKKGYQMEYRVCHADGSLRWVLEQGEGVFDDESGYLVALEGFVTDVTERKKAEADLKSREAELDLIARTTPIMLVRCSRDLRFLYVNRAAASFRRKTPEELIGRSIYEVMGDEMFSQVKPYIDRVLAGESVEYEAELPYVEVGRRWVRVNYIPERDDGGTVTGWVATIFDITDRKRAEAALRNSELRFRSMANVTPAIIWTAAPDGAITWASDRWFEYTGISREANFREWPQVLHPDDLAHCVMEWNKAVAKGSEYEIEVRNRRHDGEYRWFLTRATPIRNTNGAIIEWYGSTTDIHDYKQAEESLREADRRKDEFLALLAHELRNPLAPIRSGLELIKYVKDDPVKLEETRETMERQTRQLISLVDDLLDVSRITRGKLVLRKRAVSLAEVVQCAVDSSQPHIEEAQHRLTIDMPPQKLILDADPNRLAQVFANLLNNAVKFTPDGGEIRLNAACEGADLILSVTDTGIGIPAEMRERIFEMFTQIDRQQEKVHTGLGIGLTLVKSLVGLHGGTIDVQSDGLNHGSTFTVRLPIVIDAPAEENAPIQVPNADPEPTKSIRRVLVVDDNKAAADMLSMVVKLLGNDVRVAADGRQACQIAADYLPDVVLMDIGMPIMNGFEAAQKIRRESWGQEMVLIALTGWGQDEDKRRSREAGFNQHLVKPPEPSQLRQILEAIEPRSLRENG